MLSRCSLDLQDGCPFWFSAVSVHAWPAQTRCVTPGGSLTHIMPAGLQAARCERNLTCISLVCPDMWNQEDAEEGLHASVAAQRGDVQSVCVCV